MAISVGVLLLVVIIAGIFLTTVGFQLARAFSKRVENRSVGQEDLADIRRRLGAIETAVDSIAIEVERMTEAQRFTAKLLAGQSEEKQQRIDRRP